MDWMLILLAVTWFFAGAATSRVLILNRDEDDLPPLLFALLLALAAPAPRPRPPAPPPVPTPGDYRMRWGVAEYRCTLRADGVYQATSRHGGGVVWQGSWGYDPKARTLFVQESDDGETWRLYLFAMRGLRGETADGLTLELTRE